MDPLPDSAPLKRFATMARARNKQDSPLLAKDDLDIDDLDDEDLTNEKVKDVL